MARATTNGTCRICSAQLSKSGMTKHLKGCREKHPGFPRDAADGNAAIDDVFHILAEGWDDPDYWIHLEVPVRQTFRELDAFLRRLWLECCGHMSMFEVGGEQVAPGSRQLARLLAPGITFSYDYDMGSTTSLRLKVLDVRTVAIPVVKRRKVGSSVLLLARNEPPKILCQCGELATKVCTNCLWDGEGWLCSSCAADHECGEEMLLPVVNSPRVGVCAYEGEGDDGRMVG